MITWRSHRRFENAPSSQPQPENARLGVTPPTTQTLPDPALDPTAVRSPDLQKTGGLKFRFDEVRPWAQDVLPPPRRETHTSCQQRGITSRRDQVDLTIS
jgi:hypothetical protein